MRPVLTRGGEGDLFCRQQLGKHLQPLQAAVGALAPVAAPVLGCPIWQNQPSPKGPCPPRASAQGDRWVRSGNLHVGAGKAVGTAEGTGGEGGRWAAADVYVGQREWAGARLQPGPGFRECDFSRLTGGQWAGSRATLRFGRGFLGLAEPGHPPRGLRARGTLRSLGTMDAAGAQSVSC